LRFGWWNFYKATVANFTVCKIPDEKPHFVSKSGSAYWDLGDRVVRWSDHWGVCASCYWQLWGESETALCGECSYGDFRKCPG